MSTNADAKRSRDSRADLEQRLQMTQAASPNLRERCAGFAFSSILRALSRSWRVTIEGSHILDELGRSQRRHILAFWHRHYITLFRLVHGRPVIVVTNQSSRGQIITEICRRNGMQTLQVAERSSRAMFAEIDDATADGLGLGIAVDGPLGPPDEVKRVVPHIANRLDCPVVPISVAATSKYIFSRRWDQLEIPLLFSRVTFVVGSPIEVAASTTAMSRERAATIEQAIKAGERVAAKT